MGEELELLPPNKRYVCPDCGKKYSRLWKCKDGIKRCTNCKKSKPTNKFYVPKEKRNQYIGNYVISDKEKDILHSQFVSQGMGSVQAWDKVNKHIRILRAMKSRRRGQETRRRNNEKKKEEQKKKFLEGLK